MTRRERAARAVYALRPFKTAMSSRPLEATMDCRVFGFEEAPAFYVADCYEVADAVLAAIKPALRAPRKQLR